MFIKVWATFLVKKPALRNDDVKIEIRAGELKKLCSKFYARGMADAAAKSPSYMDWAKSLFTNMN